MYYDTSTGLLHVATGEYRVLGDVTEFEEYTISGGMLSGGTVGNEYTTGYPTPEPPVGTPTVVYNPVTLVATYPQGFAKTSAGPFYALLDSNQSGSATLFEGCLGFDGVPYGYTQYPSYTSIGYGGSPLNAPRAVAGDGLGNFYVADTGNGYIDEFGSFCATAPPPNPAWEHRWNGSGPTTLFKSPVAVVCDPSNNVYVGDNGYPNSLVQEYASGGTTLIGSWTLTTNCKLNGLAVDSVNSNIYVSDTANGGQVEVYHVTPPTTAVLVREWGDPHSAHEFQAFMPSCIALI
jgi:hypothetical protein